MTDIMIQIEEQFAEMVKRKNDEYLAALDPEIIISIFTTENRDIEDDYRDYDGYVIITNKQTIFMGISNGQSCCERFGYFTSEDNIDDFLGKKLLGISITDVERNKKKHTSVDEGDYMFVDVETDIGVLQFVIYNSHNGYYGHTAIVRSTQLNASKRL